MDIDRYLARHRPAWDRLAALSRRGRRSTRQLTPEELEELVQLYQRVSGHLSHARATYGDASLDVALTRLVADANAAIYRTRRPVGASLRTFVSRSFPGAVWRIRAFVVAAALLTLLPALGLGAWIATSDAALDAAAPAAVRAAYIDDEFESYYSSEPAAQFAADVTFNNIQVSITAFALGILAAVGTAGILVFNGANLGIVAGLFHAAGEPGRFWGLLLPHGLLELTAVIVAGAAGLRLGWALIDPGDRPRRTALAEEGRQSVTVVIGLLAAFVVAGAIEGFVTGSGLPTLVRVGIGALVEAAFIAYVVRFGSASMDGTDGEPADHTTSWTATTALTATSP